MAVYWRALLAYGFIFWIFLCISDFLGYTNIHKYRSTALPDLDKYMEKNKNSFASKSEKPQMIEYSGMKFGMNLLIWNILTFIFAIFVCSVMKTSASAGWKLYRFLKYRNMTTEIRTSYQAYPSRIPIIIKPSSAVTSRSSDINIKQKQSVDSEKSCPNLAMDRRSVSNLSRTCRTIFKNNSIFRNIDKSFDNEEYHMHEEKYKRVREEMLKLQANSLKEHALLSRKVDGLNREKKEAVKQLTIAQKENRAAKQQVEELLQEKNILLKKLENATKEFKNNTKTKKFALAKLEEVTMSMEHLRQQLEQTSRDKEILEKKLRLLENEYNKLHERYISAQGQKELPNDVQQNTPERDVNNKHEGNDDAQSQTFQNVPTDDIVASVSQTELDMKKIQMKIKQLEKNLEHFNLAQKQQDSRLPNLDTEQGSDLSLSLRDISTDSQIEDDESRHENESTGYSSSSRYRQWAGKFGEFFGKADQFAKIQDLARKMHEKVRQLENIKEKSETIVGEETDDLADFSSNEDLQIPNKIVSSSLAFKNFLKTLNAAENVRRQYSSSHSDVSYF